MVVLELQKELAKEIEDITKDMMFKKPHGGYTTLNVFRQALHIQGEDLMNQSYVDDTYPYCIIKLIEGITEKLNSPQKITVNLVIGIWDDDFNATGHETILNIIQKVQERFLKNPVLAKHFIMNPQIKWTLKEENQHPYYGGDLILTWSTLYIEREYVL